jgi:hypothetical protein
MSSLTLTGLLRRASRRFWRSREPGADHFYATTSDAASDAIAGLSKDDVGRLFLELDSRRLRPGDIYWDADGDSTFEESLRVLLARGVGAILDRNPQVQAAYAAEDA